MDETQQQIAREVAGAVGADLNEVTNWLASGDGFPYQLNDTHDLIAEWMTYEGQFPVFLTGEMVL